MFRGKAITEKAEGGNVSVVNISNISDIGIDYANLETINEEARKVARYLRDVLITTKWFSIMWVSSQVALFMIAGWSFLTWYCCNSPSFFFVARNMKSTTKDF